jgi:sugar phosphate isomerase/epimerase
MAKRPHLSVLDYSADEVKRLADAAAESGVEVATVAGYTDFTSGLQSAEVPFVEMQLLYVRKLAELAQGLGAKIIRVFTGYSTDDSAYSADWDKCVKALREASVIAADYGVNIGVQNHHDTGVATEAYVEFLNDVDHDNCKAMYDPWVPALLEEDMYECAKALAPRMVQSTYADYIKLARYAYLPGLVNYREQKGMIRAVPLGHGFLDLKKFTRGLKDGGFDGYLCYEMCSPLRGGGDEANLDHTAATSLAYLNELIAD